jgi:hypothetical protein
MSEIRRSDHVRGDTLASPHDFSNAHSGNAINGRETIDRVGEAKNKTKRDKIIKGLVKRSILIPVDGKYQLSLPFLAKLADSVVSCREHVKDEKTPVLHIAILSTILRLYGAQSFHQVLRAAALVEEMICTDVEFRILNQ